MNIILAGPLPHQNSNGGVAIFDKNLALELLKKRYNVKIISSFNGIFDDKIRVSSFIHVHKILRTFHPDLIISSLAYSGLFAFTSTKIIKIHLLHGFTNLKNYKWLKFILMIRFDRFIRHHFNYVLSNSYFTKFINNRIFNTKSNGIFKIGIDDTYINKVKQNIYFHKKPLVLYVGRMIQAKNIKLIYKAFKNIKNYHNHITFIGYGPESKWIKAKSCENHRVSFLGFVNNNNIFKYYYKAKVFISLNPAEPFGITFVEALLNNDFIVAPNTGGQVDLLKHFPNRCRLVNINNVKEITQAIQYGLKQRLEPFSQIYNLNDFSYAQTWNDIQKVINSKKRRY